MYCISVYIRAFSKKIAIHGKKTVTKVIRNISKKCIYWLVVWLVFSSSYTRTLIRIPKFCRPESLQSLSVYRIPSAYESLFGK